MRHNLRETQGWRQLVFDWAMKSMHDFKFCIFFAHVDLMRYCTADVHVCVVAILNVSMIEFRQGSIINLVLCYLTMKYKTAKPHSDLLISSICIHNRSLYFVGFEIVSEWIPMHTNKTMQTYKHIVFFIASTMKQNYRLINGILISTFKPPS